VEEGYKSVFQYIFNNVRSTFIQELEDEEYIVQIFTNSTLVKTYSTIDPNKVWLLIDRLPNYSRKNLFGLENSYIQICIQQI